MTKVQGFNQLFMDQLEDMYSSEHQILELLPRLIKLASLPELKEAITNHQKETQQQVIRLEKIFNLLDESPEEKTCEAMKGLVEEAEDLAENKGKSALLDAAIISAAQKIEHYEIASYGTLKSFAKHLDLDEEIIDLLDETLQEEGAADKKLTSIAEGSFFSGGVNKAAAQQNPNNTKNSNNTKNPKRT